MGYSPVTGSHLCAPSQEWDRPWGQRQPHSSPAPAAINPVVQSLSPDTSWASECPCGGSMGECECEEQGGLPLKTHCASRALPLLLWMEDWLPGQKDGTRCFTPAVELCSTLTLSLPPTASQRAPLLLLAYVVALPALSLVGAAQDLTLFSRSVSNSSTSALSVLTDGRYTEGLHLCRQNPAWTPCTGVLPSLCVWFRIGKVGPAGRWGLGCLSKQLSKSSAGCSGME